MARTYYSQILHEFHWDLISKGMDKVAADYRELYDGTDDFTYEGTAFGISFWAGKEAYYPEADDDFIVSLYIGRNFHLAPSGKYYVPWSTNVTAAEAEKDTRYWEAFEKVLDKFNLYGDTGEGDPTDLFVKRTYYANPS